MDMLKDIFQELKVNNKIVRLASCCVLIWWLKALNKPVSSVGYLAGVVESHYSQ